MNNQLTVRSLFDREDVRAKFKEMLGKRAPQFITSVLQVTSQNSLLANADPVSVYQSAVLAATLDLPLNPNLGFAYIVPYNKKQPDGSHKCVAQFQVGAKGFKQLALRTGHFKTIHESDVREGEMKSYDRLTGNIHFNWIQDDKERERMPVVGYVSYFELKDGYSQTFYMPIEKLKEHAEKYSQTYKRGYGMWIDDFDAMCRKTVTKLNLSKNAPLSLSIIQLALTADQAVINDAETVDVDYVDNDIEKVDKVKERKAIVEQLEGEVAADITEVTKQVKAKKLNNV